MYSVTQRIRQVKQPFGGYINPKEFTVIHMEDSIYIEPEENIHSSLVGMAVDYLTRYTIGTPKNEAFDIAILGSSLVKEEKYAEELLSGIVGLDDKSIINACKLVGYDVCVRAGLIGYRPVQKINPDADTVLNVKTMVNRSLNFINEFGPIIKDSFTFEGGYTNIISSDDGDFLTDSTLWDFKVSKNAPTKVHTLQLLTYYLLGKHSIHEEFINIEKLGIFNPRLNNIYLLDLSKVSQITQGLVSTEVIGY